MELISMYNLLVNNNISKENIKKHNSFNTVVQDNILIKACHKMNRNELLAFKQIISMVDIKKESNIVQLTKENIVNFIFPNTKQLRLSKHKIQGNYYKKALQYCRKLRKTGVEIQTENEILLCSIISFVKWNKNTNIYCHI